MGGNALKPHKTVRLDAKIYDQITKTVMDKIKKYDAGTSDRLILLQIPSYKKKESHGDLDIIYVDVNESLKTDTNRIEYIVKGLWPNSPIRKNSNCLSFGYPIGNDEYFQVDLIKSNRKEIAFSYYYFSYNDLGNLIGRVAHKMGLKFGHDGLWYLMREGDYLVGEILLTDNFFEAIEFLGFSVTRYKKGFDTLEDIFEYVSDSMYFNPSIFDLVKRSREARVRDKKRPTYTKFLKWCDSIKIEDCYEYHDKKEPYIHSALVYFDKMDELNKMLSNNEERKFKKSKINGNMVRNVTNVTGTELGSLMSYIREQIQLKESQGINVYVENCDNFVFECFNQWLTIK